MLNPGNDILKRIFGENILNSPSPISTPHKHTQQLKFVLFLASKMRKSGNLFKTLAFGKLF